MLLYILIKKKKVKKKLQYCIIQRAKKIPQATIKNMGHGYVHFQNIIISFCESLRTYKKHFTDCIFYIKNYMIYEKKKKNSGIF